MDGLGERVERSTAPAARARLIGRHEDLELVVRLVLDPAARLITLTGRSGVGKTALATDVLRTVLAESSVAASFAQADHRNGPASLARIAVVLDGATSAAGTAPAGRARLVVLDGLDALNGVDGRATLLPLLSRALDEHEDLTVLVTSTAPLGLRGEHLVRVDPLPVGSSGRSRSEPSSSPAVQLLLDRMSMHDPTLPLDHVDLGDALEICRSLDGLPLAIELVAPTCATIGLKATRALVEDAALELLDEGPADLDERHRGLRATVAWSYAQLAPDEQATLRCLSCFADSSSLDAAIAVCSPAPRHRVIAHLEHLVSSGMVERVDGPNPGAAPRYRLPATVRSYAAEMADAAGEAAAHRRAHALHHRGAARRAASTLGGPEGAEPHAEVIADLAEHLAAYDHVRTMDGRERWEETLRYLLDLTPALADAGMAGPASALLMEHLLDLAADAHGAALVVEAWAAATELATLSSGSEVDPWSLVEHLDRAERAFDGPADASTRMITDTARIQLRLASGDLAGAAQVADRVDHRTLPQSRAAARLISWTALAANQCGDHPAALERGAAARAMALAVGDERQALRTAFGMSSIPGATGLPSMDELLATARRLEDRTLEGPAAIALALTRAASGDLPGAAAELSTALDLCQRSSYWHIEEIAVIALATIAAVHQRTEVAAVLHGATRRRLPVVERYVAPTHLRLHLDAVEFARSQHRGGDFDAIAGRGEAMTWTDVLTFARRSIDDLGAADGEAPPTSPGAQVGRAGRAGTDAPTGPAEHLTDRERDVLALVAQGLTNKEIASRLGLRPKTVMHHTSSIYRKLGVSTRTEAAAVAMRAGLVDADGPLSGSSAETT